VCGLAKVADTLLALSCAHNAHKASAARSDGHPHLRAEVTHRSMGLEVHTALLRSRLLNVRRRLQGEGAGPSPLPDLALLSADAGRITHVAMGRYQKMVVTADGTILSWQWRGHPEDCSAGQLGRPGPSLGNPTPLNGVLHGLHVRARPSSFCIGFTSSLGSGNQTFAPCCSLPSRLFPLRGEAENPKSTVLIPSTD
jgi:hypothetical protein